MEDPQPPSTQPKKLLFKRTVRKSAEKPKEDDDGLSLFSRSNEYFPTVIQDRQREAAEKAAKAERERKEKLERAKKAEEEALRDEESFLHRQARTDKDEDEEDNGSTSSKKRRHISLLDDESDDGITSTPRKSQKSSSAYSKSPSRTRRDSSTRAARITRSSGATQLRDSSAIIALDNNDDETKDTKPPRSLSPPTTKTSSAKHQELSEDSDLEIFETEPTLASGGDGDADFNKYIKGAMERAEKRKREQLERKAAAAAADAGVPSSGGSNAGDTRGRAGSEQQQQDQEPVVQILISSELEGIQPIVFKRKLHQPLALVRETWVEMQHKKQLQQLQEASAPAPATTPRNVLESMFFTWRGDKVYPSATLETLGIQPPSATDGSLFRPSRYQRQEPGDASSGYWGRDKVHFEAWTQPMYEEYVQRRERERLRARGELEDSDEGDSGAGEAATGGGHGAGAGAGDEPQEKEKEKGVKVILKARGMENEHVRARASTSMATLAVVFKRLKKLPADAVVELHWDGEVLAPDSTVEDAEMEDLDCLEVHIK